MVVYYGDVSTGGSGNLTWFRANQDNGPSLIFDPSKWDPIGSNGISGQIFVKDGNNNINTTTLIEFTNDFVVTFLGNSAKIELNPGSVGFWAPTISDSSTIFYEDNVLIGTDTVINSNYQLTVAGNTFISGDLIISGLVDGIDLTAFFNDYTTHTHTIVPNTLLNYTALYPTSNGALADMNINTVTLATDDVLAWDNTIKRWINKALTTGPHTLGSHTDVDLSVSIAPLNNQILRYNSTTSKWENVTVLLDSSNGFATTPFAHNHDARYWTKTQLSAVTGPIINYANIFGAPVSGAPTNSQYVVISTDPALTDERVLTGSSSISVIDSGANNPVTLSVIPKTTNQKVEVSLDGTSIGVRSKINFLTPGSTITYLITDDLPNDAVNVTINSSASSGTESYVVMSASGFLPNERVLTGTSSILISDGGSNNPVLLSVIPKTTHQKIEVSLNGVSVGVRSKINFITGLISYNITDDSLNDTINITDTFSIPSIGIPDLNDVVIVPALFPGPGVGSPYNALSNVLVYDDDISKWTNIPASSLLAAISNIYLDDILDVEISSTSLFDKNILYYDSGSSLWVNGTVADVDLYTATQLNAGQLNTLYYTQSQLSGSGLGASVHWLNITNVPSFAPASHSHYLYDIVDVQDYSMSPPINGHILIWNSSLQLWVPSANPGGGSGITTVISNYSSLGTYTAAPDLTLTPSNVVPLKIQADSGISIETDTTLNIIKIGTAVDGITIDYNTAGQLTVIGGVVGDNCFTYLVATLLNGVPYTFPHDLGTSDVVVTIYDSLGNVIEIATQITATDVTLTSSVNLSNVKVVLLACVVISISGSGAVDDFGDLVTSTPTDGTFTDGVFQWTNATKIIDAFDDLNELLSFLIPPKGPALTDYSGVKAGTLANGKLSFDTSNPIFAASYIGANTAPVNPISVDGTWTASGKRIGIAPITGDITGVLNDQVVVHPGAPTPAYAADTFGDADQGDLRIYVNGVLSDTLDLTSSPGIIDTTASGTSSGFTVSAKTPSYFPTGGGFTPFQNRTGTWRVTDDDPNLVQGYNYAHVVHISGSFTRTLARFEWIIDDNTTATSITGFNLFGLVTTGSKKLSGIDYHTGGTALYDVNLDNMYRNTYYTGADAITHTGNSNSYGLLLTAPQQALGPCAGNEALQVNIVNKLATITSSGIRIINNSISLNTVAKRTVQGTVTSPSDSINNILLDNVAATSTLLVEDFNDEAYRLNANSSYNLVADITNPANTWDSIQSVKDGSAGHTTGLQTIDGKLIYPGLNVSYPSDFRTSNIIEGSAFNDGGIGGTARLYSGLTGNRTYYRYFRQVSPTTANFILKIDGTGGTFVSDATALTGNNVHVHIKGPTETGWMDAYKDFVTGSFADGDGARNATLGAGRALGVNWGLTIGTKNTANTSGYMLIRITVGPAFTGNFDKITWTYS